MIAIFKRDVQAYFNTLTAWILGAGYLFIMGLLYCLMVDSFSERSMMAGMGPYGQAPKIMDDLIVPLVWWMGFLMMFILPMLTMRLIAEERRTGTLEMLFTYPLSEWQIVLGKFTAAMSVVAVVLLFTLSAMVALGRKAHLEWSLVGAGYLALLLVAACFVAFGLWASSLTESQVVAAVVTYTGLMMAWLAQLLDRMFPDLKEKLGSLSVMEHLENVVRGNAQTHDLIFYLVWIFLFLFLTVRVLESRKWSS